MSTQLTTIKKVLLITTFTMLSFSSVIAFEPDNSINEYDSMYKYSAIENNSISPDLVANVSNTSVKKLPDINNVNQNDFILRLESISEKQNSIFKLLEDAKDEINNRGKIKSFLIGNNLGVLNFQMVQVNNLVFRYNDLLLEIKDTGDVSQIDYILNEIKLLKEKKLEVKNFILEKDKEFSLFGWLVTSI